MNRHNINLHQAIKYVGLYFNTLDYRTPHSRRDIEVIWVLEGNLEVQVGDNRCMAWEGEMILINSGQLHEIKATGKSYALLGIQISPDLVAEDAPEFEHIHFDRYFVNGLPQEIYEDIEQTLLDMTWQCLTQPAFYESFCRNQIRPFLYTLLSYLPYHAFTEEQSQTQKNQNARLKRLIQFVNTNRQSGIRLSDFIEREGQSLSYISYFVRSTMHQSSREYVDLIRYNAVRKIMAMGRYKMLDIRMEYGFSNYRYFLEAFVSRTGVIPEVYRKKLLERVGNEIIFKRSTYSSERSYTSKQSMEPVKKYREKYR